MFPIHCKKLIKQKTGYNKKWMSELLSGTNIVTKNIKQKTMINKD